jgi:hypothetical protein
LRRQCDNKGYLSVSAGSWTSPTVVVFPGDALSADRAHNMSLMSDTTHVVQRGLPTDFLVKLIVVDLRGTVKASP